MGKYHSILSVEEYQNGLPVRLKLQERHEDGPRPYYTVTWRTLYRRGRNRRFYHAPSEGGCWIIPCQLALNILSLADQNHMLDPKYDDPYVRFGGGGSVVRLSTRLSRNQREILFQEITGYPMEPDWGPTPIFMVADEVGGGQWRKIMIVASNLDFCTFRSTTTDESYKPSIISRNQSVWRLDNAMQDASTAIMREFFDILRTII